MMKVKQKTKVREPSRAIRESAEEPTRKKKKKVSTELTVVGSTEISKDDKKVLKSYFGKHAKRIQDMLEMNDNDGGLSLLQKKLLQTTIRLIPYAEGIITSTKSARNIYQYNTLVSQVREIMADIRANEDRRYIAEKIVMYSVRPVFVDLAQKVITEHHEFRKLTERYVKDKHSQKFNEELQQLARRLAQEMQIGYKELEAKIIENLKS